MKEFSVAGLLKQYRGLIFISALTQILFSSLALAMPLMLQVAIDKIFPAQNYKLFVLLIGVMMSIYMVRFILRLMAGYFGVYTVTRVLLDVRQRVFKHLQNLSLRFYDEYRTGKLISNVISDVGLLQGLVSLCISMLDQFVTMLLITGFLFFINWKLALIAMCALPLHFINFKYFNGALRRNSLEMQEKMSEVSANLSENINGIKIVKSFAKERRECRRFFNTMRPTLDISVLMNQQSNTCGGIFEMMSVMTYLAVIGVGTSLVGNDFTIGEFVAFYTYVGMQIGPIANLAAQLNTMSQGFAGAERIVKLLRVIPEIQDSSSPIAAGRFVGNIKFEKVSFSYKDTPVIKELNLEITPGQKVALVGPSGCGKSTISNLLLRFYDVKSGSIKVDGIDIRNYSQESYRNNIGVVLQEPFLFSGTIRDNIAYARKTATREEVEKAAEMANVLEFVNKLDHGFDTIIGENGASLSGGQKQRLAIARAVLKNPSILILDEATSALDTVSEKLVQQALDKLMENRTTLIIAHRLSTIRNADKIVVLKDGIIEQCGTHDELMEMDGTYKKLYTIQQKTAAELGELPSDTIKYKHL
ncbi:MAG: ABC transporter ATP-binding protein/permease [Lentisphaeria bacterium]|nr:ABC transporter ATP-binding protein/permease [Lentisphaeria bacterium]